MRPLSVAGRLRATVEAGERVLLPIGMPGKYQTQLKRQGYRVRQSRSGAPADGVYAWCERYAPGDERKPGRPGRPPRV